LPGSTFRHLAMQNLLAGAAQVVRLAANVATNLAFPMVLGAALFDRYVLLLGLALFAVEFLDPGINYAAVRGISSSQGSGDLGQRQRVFRYFV